MYFWAMGVSKNLVKFILKRVQEKLKLSAPEWSRGSFFYPAFLGNSIDQGSFCESEGMLGAQ